MTLIDVVQDHSHERATDLMDSLLHPLQHGARETADEEDGPQPPRIVVYRRPLMARADGEEELGELVFDVVVEEFARILGIDPEDVDPGYAGGE